MKEPRKDLCELAAKLWRLKLGTLHDNGANDPANFMANMMATEMSAKSKPAESKLDKFEELLVGKMLEARVYDHSDFKANPMPFKVIPPEEQTDDEWYSYGTELSCDYHPAGVLAETLEEMGVSSCVCPCKNHVKVSDHYVSASFGYAAPHWNYYPMGDSRFLVNTIYGNADDIDRMLNLARDGHIIGRIAESIDELFECQTVVTAENN